MNNSQYSEQRVPDFRRKNEKSMILASAPENPKKDEYKKKYKETKSQLEQKTQQIETLEQNNSQLKEKVRRMAENLKKLRYKDLMESKLNITTNNLNK